ncbi:MAG: hypothetical protein JXO51_06130 [Candidatus Aminicenantes bacterium]|nr:hypothetical protein [Candidatus Aminicenantes bacterium]
MKRTAFSLLAFGVAVSLLPCGARQEILKEKVSVVNVEVPVRVFLDGVPLAGLSKDDFRLIEGREEQAINGFYMRRKKMKVESVEMRPEAVAPPPRYFVLVFRVYRYNDPLRKGLDHVFQRILRESDRVLALVNDRTLLLTPALGLDGRRALLDRLLEEEAEKARLKLERFFLAVQKDVDQTRLRMLLERDSGFFAPRVIDFLDRYLRTWIEFKTQYLVPDLERFYHFARHLEAVRDEKWVLSFYQIEMFPHIKLGGRTHKEIEQLISDLQVARPEDALHARIIEQQLERIDRELNAAEGFPAEEVGKMLVKVDTTYHCFVMGTQRDSLSEDLEYKKVASDIENALREITRRSGGEVVFSGSIGSALHEIEEREDVYYVLTYEPGRPDQRGKVKVELPGRPQARLFYDDNIRADYIGDYLKKKRAADPEVLIESMAMEKRRLRLRLASFKMAAAGNGSEGRLSVVIRIHDGHGRQIFDQSRQLAAREQQVELDIDFAFLDPGRYTFLAEASDLLTGRTAMDVLQADVE